MYSKDDGGRKTIARVIQRCQETRRPPRDGGVGEGGGRCGCRRLLHTSCRVVNRRRFSPRYPPAPASGHKWICRLTFQGCEQQMISSSKAKDKETKAPGFLLRKHREQTLCWRANSARGLRANSTASTKFAFLGGKRDETAQKFKMQPRQRRQRRRPSRRRSNLEDNGGANEIAGRSKKK